MPHLPPLIATADTAVIIARSTPRPHLADHRFESHEEWRLLTGGYHFRDALCALEPSFARSLPDWGQASWLQTRRVDAPLVESVTPVLHPWRGAALGTRPFDALWGCHDRDLAAASGTVALFAFYLQRRAAAEQLRATLGPLNAQLSQLSGVQEQTLEYRYRLGDEFVAALKAARLYSAYQRRQLSEDQLRPIREMMEPRLAAAKAERSERIAQLRLQVAELNVQLAALAIANDAPALLMGLREGEEV